MILKSINNVDPNDLADFSCGIIDLDRFLKKYALENDQNGYGKTFVLFDENVPVGFFTLCSSSIKFDELPKEIFSSSLPRYPIPAIKIARLAVQQEKHGKGYGKELLKQAFIRIIGVSMTIGVRLIVVDAKESSASFYEHYGFSRLQNNRLTYFLLLDTLKAALKD